MARSFLIHDRSQTAPRGVWPFKVTRGGEFFCNAHSVQHALEQIHTALRVENCPVIEAVEMCHE